MKIIDGSYLNRSRRPRCLPPADARDVPVRCRLVFVGDLPARAADVPTWPRPRAGGARFPWPLPPCRRSRDAAVARCAQRSSCAFVWCGPVDPRLVLRLTVAAPRRRAFAPRVLAPSARAAPDFWPPRAAVVLFPLHFDDPHPRPIAVRCDCSIFGCAAYVAPLLPHAAPTRVRCMPQLRAALPFVRPHPQRCAVLTRRAVVLPDRRSSTPAAAFTVLFFAATLHYRFHLHILFVIFLSSFPHLMVLIFSYFFVPIYARAFIFVAIPPTPPPPHPCRSCRLPVHQP